MQELDALAVFNIVIIFAIAGLWVFLRDAANADPDDKDDLRHRLAMIGLPGGDVLVPPPEASAAERPVPLRVAGHSEPDFIVNARNAYERIVAAVAHDDLKSVEQLLTDEARVDFVTFLAARRLRGEVASLTFIGFRGAELIDSGVAGNTAWAEIRFATELVSVVRDRAGQVIEGDPRRVVQCAERWTFERDLEARQSQWRLAATDSDG
ncbi:MAG: hypothetical protein BGO82_08090 [Devosia sp. 67-54]|uniref:Tim44 domain-containing protein n=1 Tax=unclassified Devosia TaxID=196773 RepID=UPI00095A92F3|nr:MULTISPECIES: Tim44 domain-containing protein [unclassified Devosia]MBN9307279.1 Tim44 domain-containing protein [Devosia sp.]OJX19666.1 MAG: hypothetical protein BGO82_08090 [Devosia sp. 67-54]